MLYCALRQKVIVDIRVIRVAEDISPLYRGIMLYELMCVLVFASKFKAKFYKEGPLAVNLPENGIAMVSSVIFPSRADVIQFLQCLDECFRT